MAQSLCPYPITICGLAELCQHAGMGISHVLTLIDPDFPDPDDFTEYGPHRRMVRRFHDTVRADGEGTPPGPEDIRAILDFGTEADAEQARHMLIHCHLGISRSTAAAAILLARDAPGQEDEAFAQLRTIRPKSWPNSLMIAQADSMLGRGGTLIAAMRRHHRHVANSHPWLAAILRESERADEVPEDF